MLLIVGLGNPGKEYANTPHNMGFLMIDALAAKLGAEPFSLEKKFSAEVARAHAGDRQILLAKPQTFMNLSGESVQSLLHFYKLTPAQLLVIHDDADLPWGEMRLHHGRGDAGHNGIKSIMTSLGTKDFSRLRIGISEPSENRRSAGEYVLSRLTEDQTQTLTDLTEHGLEILKTWIERREQE